MQGVRELLKISCEDFVKARTTEIIEAAKKKKGAKWRPQQEAAKLKRAANKKAQRTEATEKQGGGNDDRSAH